MARSKSAVFVQLLNIGTLPVDDMPLKEHCIGGIRCQLFILDTEEWPIGNVKRVFAGSNFRYEFESELKLEQRIDWNNRLGRLRQFVHCWIKGQTVGPEIIQEGIESSSKIWVRLLPTPSADKAPADLEFGPTTVSHAGNPGTPDFFFAMAWYEIFTSIKLAQEKEGESGTSRQKWLPRTCKNCGQSYLPDYFGDELKARINTMCGRPEPIPAPEKSEESKYCSPKCAEHAKYLRRKT